MKSLRRTQRRITTAFALLLNLFLLLSSATLGRAQVMEIVHDFNSTGTNPASGLIQAADGFLYGTTKNGGAFDQGTVYRTDTSGAITILHHFQFVATNGRNPQAGLIQLADGFLYGTTNLGGVFNKGTVFKIKPDGSDFNVIKSFQCDSILFSGCNPQAGLIQLADGFLYGTTKLGGDQGTVFKIKPDGSDFNLIKLFHCGNIATNGCNPQAGLIQGIDGFLYGTTNLGGLNNQGTAFKLSTDGLTFSVIKSFKCGSILTNGCNPQAGLIQLADTSLYGTTNKGGWHDVGTVFKITPGGETFEVITTFDCSDVTTGCNPQAGLIQGSDGLLYGTTFLGGFVGSSGQGFGTVFKIKLDGPLFSLLIKMGCGVTDGCKPQAGLIQLADGFLYGTTYNGGFYNDGTVFKIRPDGTSFSVIWSFQCLVATNGCNPQAGLIQGSDEFLYGTTFNGGLVGIFGAAGTVFKIKPDGTGFSVIHTFSPSTCFGQGATDGCGPTAGLIQLADEFLYGTTQAGGASGPGTVFKIKPDGTLFNLIKSFSCGDPGGCRPQAGLIQGSDGFLFGTTYGDEVGGDSGVFKISTDGSVFSVIKSFGNCSFATNGCHPSAGLIQLPDGFLYGTTSYTSGFAAGTVFKIMPDGNQFEVIKSFNCSSATNSCSPQAGLIKSSDGFLYGTTQFFGGAIGGPGTVFKILPSGLGFEIVHSFHCDGNDGCTPLAGLIETSDGDLYGTTTAGGLYGSGTMFRVTFTQLSQAITVTQSAPASAVYNTIFNVAATGGASGNPVVIAASGACSGSGNNTAIITMTSGTGTCTVTFNQAGDATFSAAPTVTQTTTALKATPNITWNNPADITVGTVLSGSQLNATANVPGAFAYTPPAGTLLNVGNGQTLSVLFTPTEIVNYNNASANALINVLADFTPPETTITVKPPLTTTSTSATFEFTSNEAGTFECILDSGAGFSACTTPKTYNGLADGSHTFQVRAIDGANNTDSTPASFNWTITAAPDTLITANDTGPATNKTTVNFSFASDDPSAIFACSLDNVAFSACTSPKTYTKLKTGAHNFKVQATASGVTDPTPASFDWTIDKTAPNTTITAAPALLTNNPIATFEFTSTEVGGGFQCSLDGGAFADCTSPFGSNALADGKHNFQVKAFDAAGNMDKSAAKAKAWTVDTTPPNTTITKMPTTPTTSTSAAFKFTSEKKSTFQCSLDGQPSTLCKTGQKYSGLSTGPHTFQVQATDAAGNIELLPAVFDWTIQ